MKIVTVTIAGPVPKEGWVILNCMAAEGGRTSVGYQLGARDTPETVAAGLASAMTGRPEWPSFFKASAKGDAVRVSCPDDVNKVNGVQFVAEYNPDPFQRAPHQLAPDWVRVEDETWG